MEDAVIAVEAVDKRFGPTPILRQATLAVPRSQTCGIVGVNGSGKTTLLRCLVGLIRPNAGRVAVLGQEVYPQLGPLPRGLGAVIEQPAFFGLPDGLAQSGAVGLTGAGRRPARPPRGGTGAGGTGSRQPSEAAVVFSWDAPAVGAGASDYGGALPAYSR